MPNPNSETRLTVAGIKYVINSDGSLLVDDCYDYYANGLYTEQSTGKGGRGIKKLIASIKRRKRHAKANKGKGK